jgi:hypothetical protein
MRSGSIQEIVLRCKSARIPWYRVAILIAVGFASFALGRMSALATPHVPVVLYVPETMMASVESVQQNIEKESSGQSTMIADDALGGKVVVSKQGTTYHFPWCSGGTRIADENKIWFSSIEEAREAGYKPARNCKGLP